MITQKFSQKFSIAFFDESKATRNFSRTPAKVVGYARLSFDEDGEGYASIINQRNILYDYYESHFMSDDSTYDFVEDDNVSGYKFERDGLFRIMNMIENGQCNTLIAKDLSRIGRHGALLQLFIEQCERVGVRIVAMNDYDSHKESDELILGIRAWSNERLVKDTSAKIKKVIRHKQKEGTWLCAVPYGYTVTDYSKGEVAIDPIPAQIIQRIGQMYLSGMGINKIARVLTEEGVPTASMWHRDQALAKGKPYRKQVTTKWTASVLGKMLDDPFYTGTLVTGKYKRKGINGVDVRTEQEEQHHFPNHHEAIWSEETFEAIKEKKAKRKESGYRGVRKYEHPFHGVLFCGECGQRMYAYTRPGLAPQYICSTNFKYGKNACSRHTVKERTLLTIAMANLEAIKETSADVIEELDRSYRESLRNRRTNAVTIASLTKELDGLKEELLAIESQRVKQIIRQPDREAVLNSIYDEMHSNTQASIDKLTKEIETLSAQDEFSTEALSKTKSAAAILDEVIEKRSFTHSDIEALFEKIIVHDDGRIIVHTTTALDSLPETSSTIVDKSFHQPEQMFDVETIATPEECVNIVNEGDPSLTSFILLLRRAEAICRVAGSISRTL